MPFPFFCDFKGDLAEAVRQGRRKEYGLGLCEIRRRGGLIRLRNRPFNPRCWIGNRATNRQAANGWRWCGSFSPYAGGKSSPGLRRRPWRGPYCRQQLVDGHWRLGDGARLELRANLSNREITDRPRETSGIPIWGGTPGDVMQPWSVFWRLDPR